MLISLRRSHLSRNPPHHRRKTGDNRIQAGFGMFHQQAKGDSMPEITIGTRAYQGEVIEVLFNVGKHSPFGQFKQFQNPPGWWWGLFQAWSGVRGGSGRGRGGGSNPPARLWPFSSADNCAVSPSLLACVFKSARWLHAWLLACFSVKIEHSAILYSLPPFQIGHLERDDGQTPHVPRILAAAKRFDKWCPVINA